ncbi:unnamed protein product, partial [marine sediment metagenome]
IKKDPIQNIDCILQHQNCRGLTRAKTKCRNRAFPGNFGYCRVHRNTDFDMGDIDYLSTLLTREFQLNFHSKVALYDLFLAALNTYGERYKHGKGFYDDYKVCLQDAGHYKQVYQRFGLPYPGDEYFLNMAKHLFNCSDLQE